MFYSVYYTSLHFPPQKGAFQLESPKTITVFLKQIEALDSLPFDKETSIPPDCMISVSGTHTDGTRSFDNCLRALTVLWIILLKYHRT